MPATTSTPAPTPTPAEKLRELKNLVAAAEKAAALQTKEKDVRGLKCFVGEPLSRIRAELPDAEADAIDRAVQNVEKAINHLERTIETDRATVAKAEVAYEGQKRRADKPQKDFEYLKNYL